MLKNIILFIYYSTPIFKLLILIKNILLNNPKASLIFFFETINNTPKNVRQRSWKKAHKVKEHKDRIFFQC